MSRNTVCPHGNANGPCNACRTSAIRARAEHKRDEAKATMDRETMARHKALSLAGARGVTWAKTYHEASDITKRAMLLDLDAAEVR